MATDRRPLWDGEPGSAWMPYDPSRDGPWDLARAAHLHRRAGFGATRSRLARDVELGPESAVGHLIDGDAECPDGRARTAFEDIAGAMADSARRDPAIVRVRLAWLFRLLNGPHPLRERMTLAWHGHYATAASKVDNPQAMLEQNESIRTLWDAPISRLHRAMLDSSAMQLWLDGPASKKGQPNENLGREFLELFALGEGAYTEVDVKAAARALTGYRLGDGERRYSLRPVTFDARLHDDGEKTLFGRTGRWGPPDLVRMASGHPASAKTVARRLFMTFVDDIEAPPEPLVAALADLIRTPGDVDVARGIRIVLRSRLFHSEAVRGRRVKSPVEFVAGLVRAGGWYRPTPDPAAIDLHLTRMGQTLLEPPSVAGWPGGYAWLGAPLLIARANFVAGITTGRGVDAQLRTIAEAQDCRSPSAWSRALAAAFLPGAAPAAARSPASHVEALRLVASVPEAHLA